VGFPRQSAAGDRYGNINNEIWTVSDAGAFTATDCILF
jgi:hypothetical protein